MCSKKSNYAEKLTVDAKLHHFDKIKLVDNTYQYS